VTLATSSYRLWRPDLGVPVRTSVGPPRWFPDPLIEWPTVYPSWALVRGKLDQPTYRRKYRHQLHRLTPKVLAELHDLQEGYCAPLVLLCHCTRGFCHRRFLAEWISQHTGEDIPELPGFRAKP
jgi:hypothetical protein